VGGLFSSMIGSGFTATTLYEELLNRQPSASELAACNDAGLPLCFEALIGYPGTTTPISAPNSGFQITNASYVRMLYYVILGRDPDPAGLAFWLGVANSCGPGIYFQGSAGYSCRIQILGPGTPNQGFIGSPEFQGLFAN
jgi:hypothetical protein